MPYQPLACPLHPQLADMHSVPVHLCQAAARQAAAVDLPLEPCLWASIQHEIPTEPYSFCSFARPLDTCTAKPAHGVDNDNMIVWHVRCLQINTCQYMGGRVTSVNM